MNKSNNESAKNVLDMQQESGSENEESDSITDHSSSMSEHVKRHRKKSSSTTATQFSVQRSDTDGLRMKISAIRPVATTAGTTTAGSGSGKSKHLESRKEAAATAVAGAAKLKSPQINDKVTNNNTVETLKVRINNKNKTSTSSSSSHQQKQKEKHKQKEKEKEKEKQQEKETSKKEDFALQRKGATTPAATMLVDSTTTESNTTDSNAAAAVSDIKSDTNSNTATTTTNETTSSNSTHAAELPLMLIPQPPCLSDATESGCSEATTTTIAAGIEKAKKIKVKRKKAQSTKGNEVKKALHKVRQQSHFSSDTDDEPLKQQQQQQQRAPRLLLTAINSTKSTGPQLKSLANAAGSAAAPAHGSDNIGISSSDNELPDLVSAAIKRVESDTDDPGEGFRKAKTKQLPQYQSTLLQDFMEKTQRLGQTPARVTSPERPTKSTRAEPSTSSNANPQSDNVASSSGVVKKRRGRPKKVETVEAEAAASSATATTINESADSGVISTTSTTQSTSPSPKVSSTATVTAAATSTTGTGSPHQHKPRKHETDSATTSPVKSSNDTAATSSSTSKHKINIAYLDKRMYATERVLYPPPRNKRRQSSSANASQKSGSHQDRKSAALAKITKEELQLDPVWRKIDVNKKFRRPSLSGYKSDGGAGNVTVCSKILAAKSGYVSDYGSVHARSHHHNSGYKSDASGKSRYSTKSCASRRSRAKSCGYRSDCKESGTVLKSTKFRRKRRTSLMKTHSKSVGNLNDEQDILQLAGLSLGQSSEESNEYVCKPTLESLPTTSISKKYGEINRFIATGEYFGRGSSAVGATFGSLHAKRIYEVANEDASQDAFAHNFSGKLLMPRKNSFTSELAHEMLPHTSRKIKSRRSSAASYCSSYYSGFSKVKRRRKRKSYRFPSTSKSAAIDSKLLTEIDIITSTFGTLCRINTGDKPTSGLGGKEKLLAEPSKYQCLSSGGSGSTTKREGRDKRALKKRKINENLDYAMLSAAGGALTPSGSSTKRRHKKANSSSPDDHKLPLKKRHYLLTPGEKSTEAAVAVAAKLFATNAEAWAAAAAAAKTTASTKAQQQFGAKMAKAGVTPKKRHLLQNSTHLDETTSIKGSNSSPLRIVVDTATLTGGKLLDISPMSVSGTKHLTEVVHKKRSRLEGLVSKIAHHTDADVKEPTKGSTRSLISAPQLDSETSCPPPGVFEPSVELEIQIPPIAKLNETAASIVTKSEVDSPLLMDLSKTYTAAATKIEGTRVVETLLNKTGGNLILKRKRKKFNRTGFPTVRRKKRKINEHLLLDITPDISDEAEKLTVETITKTVTVSTKSSEVSEASGKLCDRVPQAGEASDTFLERANRTPRLSVVALERLQGTPMPAAAMTPPLITTTAQNKEKLSTKQRQPSKKQKLDKEALEEETHKPHKKAKLLRTEAVPVPMPMPMPMPMPIPVPVEPPTPTSSKRSRARKSKNYANMHSGHNSREIKEMKEVKTEDLATPIPIAIPAPVPAPKPKPTYKPTPPATPHKISPCIKKSQPSKSENTSFSKSTVHKIITAKSLEAKVKLPAGIDPNTNFSCKIRLKRRLAFSPVISAKTPATSKDMLPPRSATITPADVDADSAAKNPEFDFQSHDVLPLNECHGADSEAASDTGDEKCSSASSSMRKMPRLKKNYLVAGLFSDYYKVQPVATQKSTAPALSKKHDKKHGASALMLSPNPAAIAGAKAGRSVLLPPPPYCESYLRRTQVDFSLPYDIWWAYTNSKLPTRITVPSWNYRKIRTNVYAESVRPNMSGIDHPTCNCKFDAGCSDNCLNRMVYTECSPSNCPSRDKCRNQKIQRHEVAPGVERFMTENKGWGVRTKMPIKKGTYILEYVGEVVTEREFKDRMGTIYLNDIHHYCLHLDGGLVIDGHRMGSDGRFVNHSCEPNCEMQKWSVNSLSRMALFAKRNIVEGEELTYDYNFSLFNPSEGQPCRCNMPQCRGVIGGKSQRVKPLPVEAKPTEISIKDARNGRQRKRKACKSTQCMQAKEIAVARVQQLSEKEKKLVKQNGIFLVRNFEKFRRFKVKRNARRQQQQQQQLQQQQQQQITFAKPHSSVSTSAAAATSSNHVGPVAESSNRRPSTPSSLAVQISALCSTRNIKTRGLTQAVQDPEVEKMAKMAVILRDICAALETLKDPNDDKLSLTALTLSSTAGGRGKKKHPKGVHKQEAINLKRVQANIEQGYYKEPKEFDDDMQKMFEQAKQAHKLDAAKLAALEMLIAAYETRKQENYAHLLELVCEEAALLSFRAKQPDAAALKNGKPVKGSPRKMPGEAAAEDIIRCICGLYKDEGLMIQCANCMVWQHTECTKADVKADHYRCEKCEPRNVDREIPLEDFTEDGHRYYLSLMRGKLQVRQGDAVYVLRDIPIKDADGNVVPAKKHTYETIGDIDYNECDIFRVERLWKNEEGKRFIFGHHFLRPHETFHEPSRRFYPNEVVRVPLYEVVPIELVIGRCWVLDRTTFCKGRPIDCTTEEHCYICELRVDRTARFFSKAKVNYPTCTKSYAFRKFQEKLKISKTYAPHDVDPSMLKTKKQKTDTETPSTAACSARQVFNKTPQNTTRKRQGSNSPATMHFISPMPPTVQTLKQRRTRLENVLKAMKLKRNNTQVINEPPIDLSYLLSGRGARQRKTLTM